VYGVGVAGERRGTPTSASHLSFVRTQDDSSFFVFLLIQTGSLFQRPHSLAGFFNRGILTLEKKAKVNTRESFLWSAGIIATVY
jgi:hypothetical protein